MFSSKTVNVLTESIIYSHRRLLIVSKFKFFVLNLREFARLFAAMACENLVFPPQKLNSDDILQRDTREFYAAFSHLIP